MILRKQMFTIFLAEKMFSMFKRKQVFTIFLAETNVYNVLYNLRMPNWILWEGVRIHLQ